MEMRIYFIDSSDVAVQQHSLMHNHGRLQ